MRIEQEKIPDEKDFFEKFLKTRSHISISLEEKEDFLEIMRDYLNLHLKAIRYEYDQYQFFLDGYRKGSASISEVTEAHNRFLKLLE